MKKIFKFIPFIIFVVLVFFLWQGLYHDPKLLPSAMLNKPVPNFSLASLNNNSKIMTPKDFQGKVYLINIFASWCVACGEENPFLLELKNQGISIIGLNYKDKADAAQQWLSQWGNPYTEVLTDLDGRVGIDFGVYGVPETYLIDKNGVILHRFAGVLNKFAWEQEFAPKYKIAKDNKDA